MKVANLVDANGKELIITANQGRINIYTSDPVVKLVFALDQETSQQFVGALTRGFIATKEMVNCQ